MSDEFAGDVALITGAGSGIGAAVARRLAQGHADLILGDVNEEAVRDLAAELAEVGSVRVRAVHLDVTNEKSVRTAVGVAVSHFGKLTMAYNNAGIAGPNPVKLIDHELATFRQVMSINVEGVFLGMKHQIPAMLAAGGGSIVNTASILGCVAADGVVPYVTSKHAVVGLTRAAAIEYARSGIRVNSIGPGSVRTPILSHYDQATLEAIAESHPVGRLGRPEEIAETVVFLLSSKSSFTTGVFYPVDGGFTAQ